MITAVEARAAVYESIQHDDINTSDKVQNLLNKIEKEISNSIKKQIYNCTVDCIEVYEGRGGNIWGFYYKNNVINKTIKRLKGLGYIVKIDRKKKKNDIDYYYKNLYISWR